MATGRVPTTANSPLTAKGDLFGYSTTQARVPVGSDGDTLVAISANSTGLGWQGNYSAGKNAIINGDFRIWQRGTSFAPAGTGIYTADRWNVQYSAATGATVSQYAMSSAELANFIYGVNVPGTLTDGVNGYLLFRQLIENVNTYAGQTVTVSFYAKGSASGTIGVRLVQNFGSGGSVSSEVGITPQTQAITTTWTRYSLTFTVPSISGKTLGTNNDSRLVVNFDKNIGTGYSLGYGTNPNYTGTMILTGVQVEVGSVATAFQTATGTLAGELAACQRYYFRETGSSIYLASGGIAGSTTVAYVIMRHPVTMRIAPTSVEYSSLKLQIITNSFNLTNCTISDASPHSSVINATVASGLTATTQSYMLMTQASATAYLGLNAEL